MASFNKVIVLGNLTREVDYRSTASGKSVAELNVAVNRRNGERNEVCFLKVVAWGRIADNCRQYLGKGSCVMVEGYLRQDNWEDRNTGNRRSSLSIVAETLQFITSPHKGQSTAAGSPDRSYGDYGRDSTPRRYSESDCPDYRDEHAEAKANGYQPQPPESEAEDDIPF